MVVNKLLSGAGSNLDRMPNVNKATDAESVNKRIGSFTGVSLSSPGGVAAEVQVTKPGSPVRMHDAEGQLL
jgi:hypothetical protein